MRYNRSVISGVCNLLSQSLAVPKGRLCGNLGSYFALLAIGIIVVEHTVPVAALVPLLGILGRLG